VVCFRSLDWQTLGTLLGKKGTKSPVHLRWTSTRFWTVNKPLLIGSLNPRVIYLSIWLTLIFIIAYTLAFLFVSLKVGVNLDTKLELQEVHHPLWQDGWVPIGNIILYIFQKNYILIYVLLCIQCKIHEEEAAATRWEQESGDKDDNNKEKFVQCFH
jgi:hypothetical protein